MANSDFWHDLAAEFRALPGGNVLRGDWDYTANSGRPYQWRFAGGDKAIHTRFEALARRAASEMPNPEYSDLLLSWLEALRKNSHQPGIMGDYLEQNADGSDGPIHVVGSLHSLCEESAIYCDQLESDARQKEFEEKQRNDPWNWSPLRREVEAFISVKKLRDAPPMRIPEWFIRKAIARIHGIDPEEVTPKQIHFEVAGLVPFYHSIELIPDVPPSVPDTDDQLTVADDGPNPIPPSSPEETIAVQLQRLREECRWSVEKLAATVDLDTRTVMACVLLVTSLCIRIIRKPTAVCFSRIALL